jgi:hypothetical protein
MAASRVRRRLRWSACAASGAISSSAAGRNLHKLMREVLPAKPGFDLVVDVDPQQLL